MWEVIELCGKELEQLLNAKIFIFDGWPHSLNPMNLRQFNQIYAPHLRAVGYNVQYSERIGERCYQYPIIQVTLDVPESQLVFPGECQNKSTEFIKLIYDSPAKWRKYVSDSYAKILNDIQRSLINSLTHSYSRASYQLITSRHARIIHGMIYRKMFEHISSVLTAALFNITISSDPVQLLVTLSDEMKSFEDTEHNVILPSAYLAEDLQKMTPAIQPFIEKYVLNSRPFNNCTHADDADCELCNSCREFGRELIRRRAIWTSMATNAANHPAYREYYEKCFTKAERMCRQGHIIYNPIGTQILERPCYYSKDLNRSKDCELDQFHHMHNQIFEEELAEYRRRAHANCIIRHVEFADGNLFRKYPQYKYGGVMITWPK